MVNQKWINLITYKEKLHKGKTMNDWIFLYYAWCLKCISESQTGHIKTKGEYEDEKFKK